jgi:hypothetical protein
VESELTEDEPESDPVATPGIESPSTTDDDDVPETYPALVLVPSGDVTMITAAAPSCEELADAAPPVVATNAAPATQSNVHRRSRCQRDPEVPISPCKGTACAAG